LFPLQRLCRVLQVSRCGYYAWKRRGECPRAREDRRLRVLVREVYDRNRRIYGSPRIHAGLLSRHEHVSRKRVIRLMQQEGIRGRSRRRYKVTTQSNHDQPVAPDRLQREFWAERPNERWAGDTTELLVGESGTKLYLAVILDLYSRFVVGWAVSPANDRHLTIAALEMALGRRCPARELLFHSDQGSTYASADYQDMLSEHGMICSMSRRGNCLDNAVVESWHSTLKNELGERFASYSLAKEQLFDYIEAFYNPQRLHSSLGYVSPAEYERGTGRRPGAGASRSPIGRGISNGAGDGFAFPYGQPEDGLPTGKPRHLRPLF
jgi:putative transposase